MKKYQLIMIVLAGVLFSCQKLDIEPTNVITPDVIFGGEGGMDVYMANIYRKLPIEDFRYRPGGEGRSGMNLHHEWQNFFHAGGAVGEMVGPNEGTDDVADGFGYWPYDDIRAVNYILENLPKKAGAFTETRVKELLGEAYFCRAFFYFALAKRYGGVPIITTVQNYPEQTIEQLQVPRDKEDDLWEFIGADLDKAYEMMGTSEIRGRANKYVAAALKSRAMLYAGSIARYGSINFVDGDARSAGFVGIPAAKADSYFQKAWDAAKLLDGVYSLYTKNPDKEKNYADLFLDVESSENILVRDYSITTNTAHSWDATFSPSYMTVGPESRAYPTLEFVQRWGTLPVNEANGTPKRFNNLADLMQGEEPRLLATVYFPGATLRGFTFDTQRGLYPSFSGTAAAEIAKPLDQRTSVTTSDPNTLYDYNGGKVRIIGQAGMKRPGAPDNATRTGFFVRKYIDYKRAKEQTGLFQSTQNWIEFRYAEILLNRAEAAVELNKPDDALTCMTLIRSRAGAVPPTIGQMTINEVRNERCKELAFENHYLWDIRRWRIADVILDNARFKGLMPYLVLDENKYIFLAEPETFERNYNFNKKYYYEPIPGDQLGRNPKLYPQNPNY
jgi:hypothetical protein